MTDSTLNSPAPKNATVKITVSADRMSVTVIGYTPPESEGAPLDIDGLRRQIADMGVTAVPDDFALKKVLNYVRIGRPFAGGIVVAKGAMPVAGEDGRMDWRVETELSTGAVQEDGRIDYRDRGLVQSVVEGTLLGRLLPPGQGISGMDVFGKTVPSKPGRVATFSAGDNVRVAENGVDVFAGVSGMIRLNGNTLSVTEALEIQGDVDFSTGDLMMTEGAISVRGTVRSGFKVQAAGSVTVEQSVEDAEIIAGGDVTVRGGVLKGNIRSSGAVTVKYAENATLHADGNIVVENSAFNSEMFTACKLTVIGGKGLIRGGSMTAGQGIEANEVGSAASAGTHLNIGIEEDTHAALMQEKEALEAQLFAFTHKYGELTLEGIANKFGDASNSLVEKSLKNLARLRHLERLLELGKKRKQQSAAAELLVRKMVHAGTTITIAGKSITLSHSVMLSRFFYDHEADEIRWSPLAKS